MTSMEKTTFIITCKGIVADIVYSLSNMIYRINRYGYKRKLIKQGFKIGKCSYLDDGVKIYHPENVIIGNNVHINSNNHFYANYGKIIIGDNVTVSPDCRFIASGYDLGGWRNEKNRKHFDGEEIYIRDGTWICTGVTILPGVKILGENVVVAAGAVVSKNIEEDNVIVAGVPAKIKKYI